MFSICTTNHNTGTEHGLIEDSLLIWRTTLAPKCYTFATVYVIDDVAYDDLGYPTNVQSLKILLLKKMTIYLCNFSVSKKYDRRWKKLVNESTQDFIVITLVIGVSGYEKNVIHSCNHIVATKTVKVMFTDVCVTLTIARPQSKTRFNHSLQHKLCPKQLLT